MIAEAYNTNPKKDNVNHPSHYKFFKKECIDVIKDCLTKEEFEGYVKGNILKYRFRAGLKDLDKRDEDLAKSNWYQDYFFEFGAFDEKDL